MFPYITRKKMELKRPVLTKIFPGKCSQKSLSDLIKETFKFISNRRLHRKRLYDIALSAKNPIIEKENHLCGELVMPTDSGYIIEYQQYR